MQIIEAFEKIKSNTLEKDELDEKLFTIPDRSEWTRALIARGARQREMFNENNAILREMRELLQGELTPEQIGALYDGCMDLYMNDVDEYELMLPVCDRILAYYRERKDYDHIIPLLYMKMYEILEIEYRIIPEELRHDVLSVCTEIASYRENYTGIEDRRIRSRIITNYYNIVVILQDNGVISTEEGYAFLREFLDFWNSEEVQKLDGADEDIAARADRIQFEWICVAMERRDQLPEEAKGFLKERAEAYWNKAIEEANGDENLVQTDIFMAKLLQRCYDGELDPKETPVIYSKYLESNIARLENKYSFEGRIFDVSDEAMDALYLYIWGIEGMQQIYKIFELDPAEYEEINTRSLTEIYEKWELLYRFLPATFMDDNLANGGFKMLARMKNREFQIGFFDRVVVRRDVTTYLHTEMVAATAKAIAAAILRDEPDIFDGLFGLTGEALREQSGQILDYVDKAARYHDVGKFGISVVINTQTRNITDAEFATIKSHPVKGMEMADMFEFLHPYRDVIGGHHKFYDGKGGYPADYDNTVSPVRAVTDLITICDCIDAATDYLGRNYRQAKKMEQLVLEFIAGSGTRYNPRMTAFLAENKTLQAELDELLNSGRLDICYRVYEEKIEK